VGDGIGGTYGAESFVCVCFHAEETRFHLVVAEQWWVELDAHDLRLAGRTLDLVFQIHPLTKVSVHVKKQKKPSLVPIRIHAHAHVLPSIHPRPLSPRAILQRRQRGVGMGQTDGRTDGRGEKETNERLWVMGRRRRWWWRWFARAPWCRWRASWRTIRSLLLFRSVWRRPRACRGGRTCTCIGSLTFLRQGLP
jgi:hypothetical protein